MTAIDIIMLEAEACATHFNGLANRSSVEYAEMYYEDYQYDLSQLDAELQILNY